MKKIRLKKILKSLGIIPNICKFCAKDLEIEKLKMIVQKIMNIYVMIVLSYIRISLENKYKEQIMI